MAEVVGNEAQCFDFHISGTQRREARSESPASYSESNYTLSGWVDHRPPFIKLLDLIPTDKKLPFGTADGLAQRIKDETVNCLNNSTGCYLAVTGVHERTLAEIENTFCEHGIRSSLRFTYDGILNALIIRLMPGVPHDMASRSFFYKLGRKIDEIPGLEGRWMPVGSAEFQAHGRRKKQGDEAIKPWTRPRLSDWPSLVLEVGHSERLHELHCDAAWWLLHSMGKTKMVILIHIQTKPKPNAIRIESWVMYRDPTRRVTRSTAARPTCRQWFHIDERGRVIPWSPGKSLVIPYMTIFDTGPDHMDPIIITKEEMKSWALSIYANMI